MHELTLALKIVQILEEQAIGHRFNQVKQVWLEMDALSCVEESALLFGLHSATRHTLAEGAEFHIDLKPANGWCHQCGDGFTTHQHTTTCPICGSPEIHCERSDALRIRELEVE